MWRTGVDVEKARAVYALVVSLQSYDMATGERGWSSDEVEQWWHGALVELLLA